VQKSHPASFSSLSISFYANALELDRKTGFTGNLVGSGRHKELLPTEDKMAAKALSLSHKVPVV
jgi:hypothetical protein